MRTGSAENANGQAGSVKCVSASGRAGSLSAYPWGPMDSAPRSSTHLDDELDAVLIGGREPGRVEIVAYDPRWRSRFAAERRRIEHIGSTSVPDLAAKPIIDVLVEVDDPGREEDYAGALEAAGFELRIREPRHRMFR